MNTVEDEAQAIVQTQLKEGGSFVILFNTDARTNPMNVEENTWTKKFDGFSFSVVTVLTAWGVVTKN